MNDGMLMYFKRAKREALEKIVLIKLLHSNLSDQILVAHQIASVG
jgi:hypothetical protein